MYGYKYQYTKGDQGLGKPNKIYVYDLLKADNDNWLPKQFKHRKGGQIKKEILWWCKRECSIWEMCGCCDIVDGGISIVWKLLKKMMQHDIIGLTKAT